MGLSRLLSNYGMGAVVVAAADEAVKFAPNDPQAHYARGTALSGVNEFARAAAAFQQAVALRPRDYQLWMELGNARDQVGDVAGAVAALSEAARLAPHYAQPRWQLGNVLLRAGRATEAFAELRRAVASDPALAPQAIDLAYSLYNGEAEAVVQAIQPPTPGAQMALAIHFAQRRHAAEAVQLFRNVQSVTRQEREWLITALLEAEAFAAAHEVWQTVDTRVAADKGDARPGVALTDGSFEGEINFAAPGFGWRAQPETPAIKLALAADEPVTGKQSLRLSWNGAAGIAVPIVSQIVLAAPQTRYRLGFAARTQKLVTGGLPLVAITDAAGTRRLLAQSAPLPQGDNAWRQYTLEFTTEPATRAILISIQRQNCTTTPCPIFGQTWFDDFSLTPMSSGR